MNNTINWLKTNLFNNWYNSLLSILSIIFIFWIFQGFANWLITLSKWEVVQVNLHLFLVGRFPKSLYWRIWIIFAIITTLLGLTVGIFNQQINQPKIFSKNYLIITAFCVAIVLVILPLQTINKIRLFGITISSLGGLLLGSKSSTKIKSWISLIWLLSFPVILWLIGGGLGLKPISTNFWNGLLLTLLMAIVSIVLSFPLGVLFALGRTSTLPIIRWFSILYIEIVRGLPLIGILFLAQVMLPLFLPENLRLDRLVRGIAGLTLFSAAYMAENVRGGLQSIPKGQIEAGKALGLNTPYIILLIVLPQALKAVIPAIVGQFIGLFKDTSLLSLVGLVELTGIARSILAQPQFLGRYTEVYLFIGVIYWVFCYVMAMTAKKLENL